MTPYEIDLLLRFYTTPDAYGATPDAPILAGTLARFVELGLIQPCERHVWREGPALACYCEALQAVPAPEKVWRIPPWGAAG